MFEEIRTHKHIIFCGDGINALGLIRGLGENGIKSVLIEEKGCEGLARHSRYVEERICAQSWDDAFNILISRFSDEEKTPFLYCCDDGAAAFLDSRYDQLKDKFFFDNAGYQGAVCKLQEKTTQLAIAQSVGFNIPKTEIVKRGEVPQTLKYPVFTKTLDSLMPGWKSEYRIIESDSQFIEEWNTIQSDTLLVQEYIDKKNEIEFHGYSAYGQVFLCLEKSYIHLPKNGFGSYMLYRVSNRDDLLKLSVSLIQKINYSGLFDIEFIEDKSGKFWFCEYNLRSVMTSYCHTGANIYCPNLWAMSMAEGRFYQTSPSKDSFIAINEIADFIYSVAHNKENILKWLKECFSADIHLIWNKKDISPFFVAISQKFKRTIKNKLKWK